MWSEDCQSSSLYALAIQVMQSKNMIVLSKQKQMNYDQKKASFD